MASVREETARGIKWGLIQKCTMQPVQFLYGIILARLISPDEMGILGLTAIFFAIAGQLQQCGFGVALIRKQDRTNEDICTVFWFNVAMSLVLSSALFLAAPWFAWFFDQPALTDLTRVSALMMFLNSTVSVHMTLYQARRDFKTPAIVSMCTTLVAMPFTIWAAYAGWSYWAPMLQGVITGILTLLIIWIVSPWKPKFIFYTSSFKEFFRFGANLAMTGMLTQFYHEIRTFIIGKFYSPAQLAYFSRAQHTCSIPLNLITSTLNPVTYPILATLQNDNLKLIHVYRQYTRMISLVVEWGMITLAANSSALIVFLYGETWSTASVYAQILCFGWMLNPLLVLNMNLCTIQGRTDLNLKFEFILRVVSIAVMVWCAFYSVKALCYAATFSSFFGLTISSIIVTRISELRIMHLVADFLPYLAFAILANIPAYLIDQQSWPALYRLAAGCSSSLVIYLLILWIKQDETANNLLSFIKDKFSKKKM